MSHYAGRTLLITGGAGGIGVETARAFLALGARVRLVDISDAALSRAHDALKGDARVELHRSTLSDVGQCTAALEAGAMPYGVVHLAGISLPDADDVGDLALFNDTMAANVRNAYQLARVFFERHEGTAGAPSRQVFAASVAYRRGGVDRIAYSAAKGAIAGMVRAMSRRYAPAMRVNAVAPGIILTPMTTGIIEKRHDRLMDEIPIRRFGHPSEVAGVIEFLCGPASTYVNGQVINVDGGMVNS